MTEIRELRPARPETQDEAQSYMPKLPWKWIVGLGVFVTLSVSVYTVREGQQAEALRKALLEAHSTQLGPLIARYDALVPKLYRMTLSVAQRGAPETYVDPRLKLDALHKGKGLYLRLKAEDAVSQERIAVAGLEMPPDAIGKCLGLAPAAAAELFARGTFLEKRWIKPAHETDSVMKLRVMAEELSQRSKRDVPFVTEALSAEWFLLVLERGDNRRDAPVDAYLWDLRTDKLLLRARAQAEGVLVAARIVVAGVKPGNYAAGAQTGAAQDCSIASQLRSIAGAQPATTFSSAPPAPREALQAQAQATTAPVNAPIPSAPLPAGSE